MDYSVNKDNWISIAAFRFLATQNLPSRALLNFFLPCEDPVGARSFLWVSWEVTGLSHNYKGLGHYRHKLGLHHDVSIVT